MSLCRIAEKLSTNITVNVFEPDSFNVTHAFRCESHAQILPERFVCCESHQQKSLLAADDIRTAKLTSASISPGQDIPTIINNEIVGSSIPVDIAPSHAVLQVTFMLFYHTNVCERGRGCGSSISVVDRSPCISTGGDAEKIIVPVSYKLSDQRASSIYRHRKRSYRLYRPRTRP